MFFPIRKPDGTFRCVRFVDDVIYQPPDQIRLSDPAMMVKYKMVDKDISE